MIIIIIIIIIIMIIIIIINNNNTRLYSAVFRNSTALCYDKVAAIFYEAENCSISICY